MKFLYFFLAFLFASVITGVTKRKIKSILFHLILGSVMLAAAFWVCLSSNKFLEKYHIDMFFTATAVYSFFNIFEIRKKEQGQRNGISEKRGKGEYLV